MSYGFDSEENEINFGGETIEDFYNFSIFILSKITNNSNMENSKHEEWNNPRPIQQDNKKIAAGLLAILLGPFGIHKFLLGYTTEGIIWLVISVCTCGTVTGLLGLIEGIIYLTKSDEEFYQTYQVGKKPWF